MATRPVFDKPVSVEEYLSMEFEHDCEYVDGVIEERETWANSSIPTCRVF